MLRKEYILSPKAKRSTRRKVTAELKALLPNNTSNKQSVNIQSSLLDLVDAHPKHPRCAYFGEMIQCISILGEALKWSVT